MASSSGSGSDPVNIEIVDKVSPSVVIKIKAIADTARDADAAVVRLRAQLSGLDASTIRALTAASNANTKAYLDQEAALNRAVAAELKAEKATADLATAHAKLAKAQQDTGAASMKAEAALNSAVLTEQRVTRAARDAEAALLAQAAANDAVRASQGFITVDPRRPGVSSAQGSASVFLKAEAAERAALVGVEEKQASVGAQLLKQLETQAALTGKSTSEIAAFRAAQAGVSAEAAPYIRKLQEAEAAVHKFSLANAGSVKEMLVVGREMSRGDTTRMAGSLTLLAQRSGLLDMVMSPLGLTLVAVGVAIGGVALAAERGEAEISRLNGQIKASGNFAGISAGSFKQMQINIAEATHGGLSETKKVLSELAFSGKVSNDNLRLLGASAVELSHMTGESADKIAQDFLKMTDGVTKYAVEFTSKYHLLNAAQIDYIRQLEHMGEKEKAEQALSEDVFNAISAKGREKLGSLERAVQATERAFGNFWEKLKSIGRDATTAEKFSAVTAQINDVQQSMLYKTSNFGERSDLLKPLYAKQAAILAVAAAQEKSDKAEAAATALQQKGIDASARLNGEWERYAKNTNAADEAIKRFRADLAATLSVNPNDSKALEDQKNQAAVEARIRKAFDPVSTAEARKAAAETERRSVTMAKLTASLKDQLTELEKIDPKNKEQIAFDLIKERMIGNKIILTDKETAAIKANLSAQANQRRTNDLDVEIKGIREHTANLKLNSDERRVQEQLDARQAAEIAKGHGPFSPQQLERMREALQLQQRIDQFARVKDAANDNAKGFVDNAATQLTQLHQFENNQAEMYARIQSMRDQDVISEQQAAMLKAQYNNQVQTERLANTQTFFGTLAQLSQSSNHELAAIGKAAAMAQATIDGVLAVQKALAAYPPPFNFIMAGAVGVVAAANVAQISGIKFADGGYVTGPGGPRDDRVSAQLSHGEFVINAKATSQHRATLEAINGNRASQAPQGYIGGSVQPANNNAPLPRIVIENHGTPQTFDYKNVSHDEIRLIARDVVHSETPGIMASEIGNPNSKLSRGIIQHTTATRKRTGGG